MKINRVSVIVVSVVVIWFQEKVMNPSAYGDQPSGMKCQTTSRTPVDSFPIAVKALGDRSIVNEDN